MIRCHRVTSSARGKLGLTLNSAWRAGSGRCGRRVDRLSEAEAPVAQLDRALPSEGRGQRFESSRARQIEPGPFRAHRLRFIPDTWVATLGSGCSWTRDSFRFSQDYRHHVQASGVAFEILKDQRGFAPGVLSRFSRNALRPRDVRSGRRGLVPSILGLGAVADRVGPGEHEGRNNEYEVDTDQPHERALVELLVEVHECLENLDR
jgi:hypothetical protein